MSNSFWLCLSLTLLYNIQSNKGSPSPPSVQHRILGGTTNLGTATDRYSVASVRYSNLQGQFHICGGFIINKRWVGTAAQCLSGQTTQNTVVAIGTTSIVLGTTYGVSLIEMHQNYNELTLVNDIGLLKTTTEITFPVGVAPAVLSKEAIPDKKIVWIYGWGRTAANSNLATSLVAQAPSTLTNDECRANFPFVARRFITDRHICTYHYLAASCPGDAGGPVYYQNSVVGIVSWVEPCWAGQTNVNTRISSYYNWIKNITSVDD